MALGALNVSCCFYVHSASGEKDSSGVTTIPYFPPFNLALNTASYNHPTSPLTLPQIIGVQLLPTTPDISYPTPQHSICTFIPPYLPPRGSVLLHILPSSKFEQKSRATSLKSSAKAALPSLSPLDENWCVHYIA